jgi:hypothetical protein
VSWDEQGGGNCIFKWHSADGKEQEIHWVYDMPIIRFPLFALNGH